MSDYRIRYTYRVHCVTEGVDHFAVGYKDDPAPTQCPIDAGHTIGDVAIVDE